MKDSSMPNPEPSGIKIPDFGGSADENASRNSKIKNQDKHSDNANSADDSSSSMADRIKQAIHRELQQKGEGEKHQLHSDGTVPVTKNIQKKDTAIPPPDERVP